MHMQWHLLTTCINIVITLWEEFQLVFKLPETALAEHKILRMYYVACNAMVIVIMHKNLYDNYDIVIIYNYKDIQFHARHTKLPIIFAMNQCNLQVN